MKERPILFSGAMVQALLAGAKTQTRRAAPIVDLNIKPHSDDLVTWGVSFSKPVKGVLGSYSGGRFSREQAICIIASQFCPYGHPGDRLWVRETWQAFERGFDVYEGIPKARPQDSCVLYAADDVDGDLGWRPSIHMPRWVSRITLEITEVRVERLQDISEADVMAEGCPLPNMASGPDPRQWYAELWDQINGRGAWDANPWVWVVSFVRKRAEAAA